MSAVITSTMRIALGFLAAAACLAPTTAQAAGDSSSVLVHRPEDLQFTVLLGPLDARSANSERSTVVRFPRAITLHRFRAELTDSAGRPLDKDTPWGVTFFTAAAQAESYLDATALARLSNGFSDLSIPRPYGVGLVQGDSIRIVAALPPSGTPGAVLRITLDYEASPASRLPAMVLASEETVAAGAWTWRAEASGRLVAIDGRQLAGADELVLEDATTGRVIWQMRAQYPARDKAELRREAVRPGVSVHGGRLYRLRIRYAAHASAEQRFGGDTPFAIIAPSRTSAGDR